MRAMLGVAVSGGLERSSDFIFRPQPLDCPVESANSVSAPLISVHTGRGMNPGTPLWTTVLNLMFVVMRSRMSCIASSGRGEIS